LENQIVIDLLVDAPIFVDPFNYFPCNLYIVNILYIIDKVSAMAISAKRRNNSLKKISLAPALGPRTLQTTLLGEEVEDMPLVRTSDGFILPWNREAIIKQLLRETSLAHTFYGIRPMKRAEAQRFAEIAEKKIKRLDVRELSGPLIREFVNVVLLEEGYSGWARVCSRVGTSLYDAYLIDHGEGFEAKENSNLTANPETSAKKKHDKLSKQQVLLMLPQPIADAHRSGDFHIHDMEYANVRPFCADYDLRYFLYYGLMPDGTGAHASVAGPAKSAEVAILHAVKALAAGQTNCAGGQGFYNFLTFLAPYLEGLDYVKIKQLMQETIFELTQVFIARGGQMVFSSLQLTPGVPELWKDKPIVMRGKVWNGEQAPLRTYGEFEREVRLAFKAVMEVMTKGDNWGKPFNFPKPEVALEPSFMVPREEDEFYGHPEIPSLEDNYDAAFELAAEFGLTYFDNMIPEYRGAGKGVSCYQCCSYMFKVEREDDAGFEDKLYFRGGAHFSMGSWHVVTLNVPRAAYKANHDDDVFIDNLKNLVDLAVEFFKIKRKWMEPLIKANRLPFLQQHPRDPNTGEMGPQLYDFESLVYTIGVVGVNNAVRYHTGYSMHEDRSAWELAIRAMTELQAYCKNIGSAHGIKIALARTPAESCAQRLAVADLLNTEFSDECRRVVEGNVAEAIKIYKKTKSRDLPIYYSNGTHIPVDVDINLFDRLQYEQVFYHCLDGGDLTHIFLGEAKSDPAGLKELCMRIAKNTQIGYFVLGRDLTLCLDDFRVDGGLHDVCMNCGSSNVEHIARVTGYMSTVSSWNAGKRQELKDRKRLTIERS